jgi:hypothetical protein
VTPWSIKRLSLNRTVAIEEYLLEYTQQCL